MTQPKRNQYVFGVDPDKGADPGIFIEGLGGGALLSAILLVYTGTIKNAVLRLSRLHVNVTAALLPEISMCQDFVL